TGSQFGLNGWGNNELQYYTNSTDNVSVQNGHLRIRALQQNVGGMNYTSGRIKTLNKQFWTYGRMEARMQLPAGQGIWPAFWMLPEGQFWPGEIDIMEIIGSNPNVLYGYSHQGTPQDVVSIGGSYTSPTPLNQEYHVYAIEWYADNVKWFIDDIEYFTLNRADFPNQYEWLFAQDYYLLLNCAVGGNWPGAPDGSTNFPADLLVDYVRVYESTTAPQPVTFKVNMMNETLQAGDIVYLNGAFNNWCGTCEPMLNEGNDIWSVTIDLPAGLHEYKFTTNGWDGLEEEWMSDQTCTITTLASPNNFINRMVNVAFEPLVLQANCFNTCQVCDDISTFGCTAPLANNYDANAINDDGSCLYTAHFEVDMNEAGLQPGDLVHLNGTFNNWCGDCNQMFDANLDGIYELDLFLSAGDYEFKFTTNGWFGLIEQFDIGASCTITSFGPGNEVYTNRSFSLAPNNYIMTAPCFDSCDACPSAINPIQQTFWVDMFNHPSQNDVTLEIIVDGEVQTHPMSASGWSIYSAIITLNEGEMYSYRFAEDNFNEDSIGACFSNTYRSVIAGDHLDVVCYSECNLCSGCQDPTYMNYNPFSSGDDQTCAVTAVFGCTYSAALNFNLANNIDDGTCLFDLSSSQCPSDFNSSGTVDAADLLTFLSEFGSTCN
ncbi:MAG: family 16 glycosylhydrolase, partial [Flavobacteriales bacterium]